MFNSVRLTTIILSVIAFVVTMTAQANAGGFRIEKTVSIEAGGNTIAGPGFVDNLPQDDEGEVYNVGGSNAARRALAVTLHCRDGNALIALLDDVSIIATKAVIEGQTGSVASQGVERVKVLCDITSPSKCDCLWRVDSLTAD